MHDLDWMSLLLGFSHIPSCCADTSAAFTLKLMNCDFMTFCLCENSTVHIASWVNMGLSNTFDQLSRRFASGEFPGIHGHITWFKSLLMLLQTDATSHVGGRFHQLFGTNLVEPAEEDLLKEIRGHVHYGSYSQSTSEKRVNFRF